jgi:hypothetical protein
MVLFTTIDSPNLRDKYSMDTYWLAV